MTFLYRLSRLFLRLFLRLWCRLRVHGVENIPASGGCVLAANHASYLDPMIAGCLVPRPVRFVARSTLAKSRLFRWWIRAVGSLLLNRGKGDVAAMRAIIRLLRNGEVICLFPEGTRTPDGRLQAAKGGIGLVVAKAGVPVVPVYIKGSFEALPRGSRWVKPTRVEAFFGPPIRADEAPRDRMGELIMARIAALRDAAAADGK